MWLAVVVDTRQRGLRWVRRSGDRDIECEYARCGEQPTRQCWHQRTTSLPGVCATQPRKRRCTPSDGDQARRAVRAAAISSNPASANNATLRRPDVEPPPVPTPPDGTWDTCGGAFVALLPVVLVPLTVADAEGLAVALGTTVAVALGVAVGTTVAVALGVAVGTTLELTVADGGAVAAAVMLVMMLVRQVTMLPPGLPVPLHWLTVIGMAGLTRDDVVTAQSMVAPPPLADPLHCVTVALVVAAGNGSQITDPPPPPPEPTHWLTVAAVRGCAPGVSALMLLVIVTLHTMGCAASLSEPLHWATLVTRLVELVVNVPLPGGQGPSRHWRTTVTVEPVVVPLMVLTTVTEHVSAVVAPSALGPMLLH